MLSALFRPHGRLMLVAGLILFGAAQAQVVRVGSKIDTEGSLLGNLIVQMLESQRHQDREQAAARQHQDRARRAARRRDRPLP